MAYNRKDFFFKEAKKQNFAARSVFKLEEIDQRFHLLKTGMKVLDLGAAPGSWSQYTSKKVGSAGRVLAIDLQKVGLKLPNVVFICGDLRDQNLEALFTEKQIPPPFDLVLSDMAPKTTGIKFTDQARSLELCELAFATACRFLRPGGHFIVKLFHGGEFENFRTELRKAFDKVEVLRPKSTRKESKEVFLIGLGYKGES